MMGEALPPAQPPDSTSGDGPSWQQTPKTGETVRLTAVRVVGAERQLAVTLFAAGAAVAAGSDAPADVSVIDFSLQALYFTADHQLRAGHVAPKIALHFHDTWVRDTPTHVAHHPPSGTFLVATRTAAGAANLCLVEEGTMRRVARLDLGLHVEPTCLKLLHLPATSALPEAIAVANQEMLGANPTGSGEGGAGSEYEGHASGSWA